MYVEGVSTRKVARITEQLCGFAVTSTEVSQCAALLDEEAETEKSLRLAWRRALLLGTGATNASGMVEAEW